METKWYLFILCVWVLSLGHFSFAKELRFNSLKKLFKAGAPKATPAVASTVEDHEEDRDPLRRASRSPGRDTAPRARPEPAEERPEPDVSLSCSASGFVVRVRRGFYGLGADAHELRLGGGCRSNGDLRPQGDLLFTYPLTACDPVRESIDGFLVYKYLLHYEPSRKGFPSRAHPFDVAIECHYLRDYAVTQLAVQPTWQTVVVRKALKGQSWRTPARIHEYFLGQTVNVQVSAPRLRPGEKLYISSCHATPLNGSSPSLKYQIIGNFGCLVDSRLEAGSSEFVSRTDNSLRFSLKAFQFTSDPNTEVSIQCKFLVTTEDPGPVHKWRELDGHDSICDCCESKCVTSKPRRALMEGSARSAALLVSDRPHTAEDGFPLRSEKISRGFNSGLKSQELIGESTAEENNDSSTDEERQLEEIEIIFGKMAEPDLQELDIKKLFQDEFGSGDEDDDLFDISEEQMIRVNQKEAGESDVGLQRELEPPECEEENGTYACRAEEDGNVASEVKLERGGRQVDLDDEERTWYFTWK
ncbi:unnamed protein product [Menidia menidia]|uniref:Zona pellucida sperm-binding protein 3 n=1 Tax=Menidia menidia TaxID=238744 RepID=A0A8S4AC64_9TELE|nr:unnamed protein product [Menidia menidia]